MLRWISRFRGPTRPRVTAEAEGFRLEWQERGRPIASGWPWAEVEGAVGFKRDCYIVDLVCVAFEAHGCVLEVDEEMEGWDEVLSHAAARLPGFPSKLAIYAAVMLPPFAECRTVLFRRSLAAP